MCREDPKMRISAADAHVRFLWLSASVDPTDLGGKLISTRKSRVTQRFIRKCEKKLPIQALLRGMGLGDDTDSTNPSPTMCVPWLPVHSV